MRDAMYKQNHLVRSSYNQHPQQDLPPAEG